MLKSFCSHLITIKQFRLQSPLTSADITNWH